MSPAVVSVSLAVGIAVHLPEDVDLAVQYLRLRPGKRLESRGTSASVGARRDFLRSWSASTSAG